MLQWSWFGRISELKKTLNVRGINIKQFYWRSLILVGSQFKVSIYSHRATFKGKNIVPTGRIFFP